MTNTISAINVLKAKKNKKGFTLMEMLIVVAIIAILVAIAIPVFSAQLNNAKTQVDAANLRSATSMAVVDYLSNAYTGDKTYVADAGTESTMTVKVAAAKTGTYKSQVSPDKSITIVVTDGGKVTSADWG